MKEMARSCCLKIGGGFGSTELMYGCSMMAFGIGLLWGKNISNSEMIESNLSGFKDGYKSVSCYDEQNIHERATTVGFLVGIVGGYFACSKIHSFASYIYNELN